MKSPEPGRTTVTTQKRFAVAETVTAQLSCVYPPNLAWSAQVRSAALALGRAGSAAASPIEHETVSRSHLEVSFDAAHATHVVRDLGSRNGSWVDGVAVGADPVALGVGSVLRLGDVLLVYDVEPVDLLGETCDVSVDAIPGRAATIRRLRDHVGRAAKDAMPVLLIGESGTGKERIASEIHRLSGRSGPFVPVNAAALSPQIVDSQLFGHVKGAFTGAVSNEPGFFRTAHGGTLFLDEIGELALEHQAKLLRVIQEREVQPVGQSRAVAVDVRIVAATNRDLAAAVEQGGFRRDLHARLALWDLRVPALRQRRQDILAWMERLLMAWHEHNPGRALPALDLQVDAAQAILLHPWPDNLRGLDRLLHGLALANARRIGAAELPAWVRAPSVRAHEEGPGPAVALKPPIPSKEELQRVLAANEGSLRATAKHFQRDRQQVRRWMDRHGLRRELISKD